MNNKFINRKHLSNRSGTSISVLAVLYMHRYFLSSLQYTQSLKAKDEWNSSFNFDLSRGDSLYKIQETRFMIGKVL